MASLNTLRTKFGVLLSVIIAGALLAFILSLKTEMGFSGNDPKVGEIDGEKVLYSEYLDAYENVKAQMGGDAAYTDEMANQLIGATWQSLVADRVFLPGFEDMGIEVSDAERTRMLSGEYPSGVYRSIFGNPRTGEYDVAVVTEFLSQVQSNPQMQKMWDIINRQALLERKMNKYASLVRGGANVNALEVERGLAAENNTYKGRYALCRYNTVADSLVTVSNSEIKNYYNDHKSLYKQLPYRTVSYVVFDVEPTDADKAAVEAEAKAAAETFAATGDIKAFVRENRRASIAGNFITAAQLPEEESKALNAGKMFGPELVNNEWKASRVVEVRNVPDSLELQHIVLSYTDDKLADSLLTAARKGADFAQLAVANSIAETAAEGGKIGTVPFSSLAPEFADALTGVRRGEIVKIVYGNVIQLMKVVNTGKVQKHMQIATLAYPVEASAATKRSVHNEASLFAVNAKGSVEKFNETANERSLSPRVMNVERGERAVRGLDSSLEVVRWVNDAKVGDVSDIFNVGKDYVVAVVTAINDKEYKEVGEVSNQIRTALLRDKKFEQIAAKMQGATIDEVAESAGVKVNTFENAKLGAYYVQGIGVEPRLLGAIAAVPADKTGTLSAPVKGNGGVFVFVVDEVAADDAQTTEAERVKMQAQTEDMSMRRAMFAVQEMADVKDNSVKYF